ncbi:hypothetical protein [Vagococcus fluvialis]|uniref:hypothetical protein n=1 Tax=Vagococcus fluvialis TaxID=2738 RepID=UPI003B2113DC
MNGYAYADNNPVMNIDPDGHWVWFAVGAGFSIYDGYKTYKKTKSWKKAGWAAAKSAATSVAIGGAFKVAGRGLKFAHSAYKARNPVLKLAKRVKYTNTVANRMANPSRYVPKYHVANTMKYGRKATDSGARGIKKLTNRTSYSTMYKNKKKYTLKVVYNKFTKRVYHTHYSKYK